MRCSSIKYTFLSKNIQIQGISELTMEYNGECTAARIKVYYAGINDDYEHLCKFKEVEPGDIITCSAEPYGTFGDSTFISIDYDCSDNRRLRRLLSSDSSDDGSSDDGSSDVATTDRPTVEPTPRPTVSPTAFPTKEPTVRTSVAPTLKPSEKYSEDGGECVAKFRTDCNRNIIGSESEGCSDLTVVSYVDATGALCDELMIIGDGSSEDAVEHNALLNGEQSMDSPLEWVQALDPFIKWVLLGIMVTFVALMGIACYFCVIRKAKRANTRRQGFGGKTETIGSYGNVAVDEECHDEESYFSKKGGRRQRVRTMSYAVDEDEYDGEYDEEYVTSTLKAEGDDNDNDNDNAIEMMRTTPSH